ncbi:MAG: hypothetical protein P8J27_00330 [Mariniblastus sp.]|nr:hypothetical protein [Mariniblastus sp.]
MTDESHAIYQLVNQDPRYPLEAYDFVRDALAYAADSIELVSHDYSDPDFDIDTANHLARRERHLTGQQLCESIRQYALNQYGYMSKVVLKSWNIRTTSCFGDIVYNMISAGIMKKSSEDKRSHFDDVYAFEEVFEQNFEICDAMLPRRS